MFLGNKLKIDYKLRDNKAHPLIMTAPCQVPAPCQVLLPIYAFFSEYFDDNTLKIVRPLNINKVCGHYEILVRMIKICDEPLVKLCL